MNEQIIDTPPGSSEWQILEIARSDYEVVLVGDQAWGLTVRPRKGQEPNWFHRWMQRLCFGFRWVKVK